MRCATQRAGGQCRQPVDERTRMLFEMEMAQLQCKMQQQQQIMVSTCLTEVSGSSATESCRHCSNAVMLSCCTMQQCNMCLVQSAV
jgi:hypothetical protein